MGELIPIREGAVPAKEAAPPSNNAPTSLADLGGDAA